MAGGTGGDSGTSIEDEEETAGTDSVIVGADAGPAVFAWPAFDGWPPELVRMIVNTPTAASRATRTPAVILD
jgi:hypothetical protein